MKPAIISSLIIGMTVLLFACGGDPDAIPANPPITNPPPPGTGTGPILQLTDDQRLTVLKECGDFASSLGDLKLEATQQVLVTYLKSRPEFEEAGVLHGNVWSYFYDGRIALFIPDWLGKDPDGGRLPMSDISSGKEETGKHNGRTGGLPEGKSVKLFHGLGNAYQDNRPYLAGIFSKSHTQYSVQLKDATVENLLDVEDLDIFYINTHGGFGSLKPRSSGKTTFCLWTSDTLRSKFEYDYRDLLDETSLVYAYALEDLDKDGKEVFEWHYGISGAFPPQYMSFGENSILYIDACMGFSQDASNFKELMMSAAKNERTTYIGWSHLSDQATGFPTSRFVFDRLLGAQVFMPENPGQRPFDLSRIFDDFPRYNLGISGYGGKLGYQAVSLTEILLTPTIEFLVMDDYESKMYIQGMFGDPPYPEAKVTVGGVAVPSIWSPYLISCDLPTTGPGSYGNVVASVRGNESNAVPLTEWIIPIELTKEEMSVTLEAKLNLRIRADVHPYRSKAGEAPKKERPDSLFSKDPNDLGLPFAIGSSASFVFGGQRQGNCTIEDCQITQTESAASRNGMLRYWPFPSTDQGFGALYKWAPDMKSVDIYLWVIIPNIGYEFKTRWLCGSNEVKNEQSVQGADARIQTDIDLPVLRLHFDDRYNITGGQFKKSSEVKWGHCMKLEKFRMEASWPTVNPHVPPGTNTQSRVGGN